MKWYSTYFIILLLLFQNILQSGEWSSPIDLAKTSRVQFRWRVVKLDSKSKQNEIEWGFRNASDSIVTFSYLIVSERNERIMGRVTILPHRVKIAGWTLSGKSILNTLIDDIHFVNPRSENGSTK